MMHVEKTLRKYKNAHDIETLLHSAGVHQGSRKAHQAGNMFQRQTHMLSLTVLAKRIFNRERSVSEKELSKAERNSTKIKHCQNKEMKYT